MRILHILDHSIPLHSGYAFRTLAILREQRALGWETMQLTSPKHRLPGPLVEEVDGWTFHRTPAVAVSLPGLAELAMMRATTQRALEIARERPPDVIHAHSPVLNAIPALRVGRRLGVPVVYEIRAFWEDAAASHGTSTQGGLRFRLTRAMETYAAERADAVTTICEGLRTALVARGLAPSKVAVIPNAVDVAAFAGPHAPDPALAAELGLAGATVLGFIGSFYGYEGLDVLIRALPAIRAGEPSAKLLLVGGGPERTALEALVATLGLGEAVVFTGRVPHERVRAYYDLVDVFVYPRRSLPLTETVTPLKPLEAMADGKIVVASDVGGHRELIRDDVTGFLFRADDPVRLAERVLAVLAARERWPRVRAEARAFVEGERSWRASVARYREVYRRLGAAA